MADWFTQNAPKAANWFEQNAPKEPEGKVSVRVTYPEDKQQAAAPAEGEAGYWEQVGSRLKEQFFPARTVPLPEAMGLTGLWRQYTETLPESKTVTEALINAVPFLGPSINEAITNWAHGKPKTSAAQLTTDVLLPVILGKISEGPPKSVRGLPGLRNPNPVEAAAVEFGQREGIPVDAGTATGNTAVRGAQWLADRSIGGSLIAGAEKQKAATALTATGERLAGRLHPSALVPEQAGQALTGALEKKISKYKGVEDAGYGQFQDIQALPENTRRVQVRQPPVEAQKPAASYAGIEPEVVPQMEGAIEARMAQMEDYFSSGIGALSGKGKNIGQAGMNAEAVANLKHSDTGFGHINVKRAFPEVESMPEAPGRIAEAIREDKNNPLYRRVRENVAEEMAKEYESDFASMNEAAVERRAMKSADNVPDWVNEVDPESSVKAKPTAGPLTEFERNVQLPVDVRPIKKALASTYESMKRWMEPAKRNASQGFTAIESIIKGDDFIQASEAEHGLSGLKTLARQAKSPDLRDVNQGLAARATKLLQAQIDAAVAEAGPEAIAALRQGRAAHAAKMGISEILATHREEPVQVFNQATWIKDAGIKRLRQLAKLAPDEMPKVGRAYLDDIFTKATAEGGFDKAKGIWARWQNLGPETKKVLFKNPALVSDLDKFFLLAKKMEENPNPSGTTFTLSLIGQSGLLFTDPMTGIPTQIGGAALSKMLHSPRGVRLLTRGMKIPISQKGASALAAREIIAASGMSKGNADQNPLLPRPNFAGERAPSIP